MSNTQAKKNNQSNNNREANMQNNWNQWMNWGKNFAQMMDYNKMKRQMQQGMEMLTAANGVYLEGMQAVSKRMADMVQQNSQQLYACTQEAMCCQDLNQMQQMQHKQMHMLQNMMQNMGEQLKETSQISSKATMEVVDMFNKEWNKSMKEWGNCATESCNK